MKTITIRRIDPGLDREIKSRAKRDNLSVNQWLLEALKRVTGMKKAPVFPEHTDLDPLAGGWSKEEERAFRKNTRIFETIDEDIWK